MKQLSWHEQALYIHSDNTALPRNSNSSYDEWHLMVYPVLSTLYRSQRHLLDYDIGDTIFTTTYNQYLAQHSSQLSARQIHDLSSKVISATNARTMLAKLNRFPPMVDILGHIHTSQWLNLSAATLERFVHYPQIVSKICNILTIY